MFIKTDLEQTVNTDSIALYGIVRTNSDDSEMNSLTVWLNCGREVTVFVGSFEECFRAEELLDSKLKVVEFLDELF